MKTLYSIILVSILALATPSFAQTNTNAASSTLTDVANAAKQTVATNLNQVMIEMLSGVKVASGEIYGASKTAIANSYEFVKKEAPEVIKEFLKWRLAEACTYLVLCIAVGTIIFVIASKVRKYANTQNSYNKGDTVAGAWALRILACVILCIGITTTSLTILKISLAPRVYIIEYVVDQVNSHNNR